MMDSQPKNLSVGVELVRAVVCDGILQFWLAFAPCPAAAAPTRPNWIKGKARSRFARWTFRATL